MQVENPHKKGLKIMDLTLKPGDYLRKAESQVGLLS